MGGGCHRSTAILEDEPGRGERGGGWLAGAARADGGPWQRRGRPAADGRGEDGPPRSATAITFLADHRRVGRLTTDANANRTQPTRHHHSRRIRRRPELLGALARPRGGRDPFDLALCGLIVAIWQARSVFSPSLLPRLSDHEPRPAGCGCLMRARRRYAARSLATFVIFLVALSQLQLESQPAFPSTRRPGRRHRAAGPLRRAHPGRDGVLLRATTPEEADAMRPEFVTARREGLSAAEARLVGDALEPRTTGAAEPGRDRCARRARHPRYLASHRTRRPTSTPRPAYSAALAARHRRHSLMQRAGRASRRPPEGSSGTTGCFEARSRS